MNVSKKADFVLGIFPHPRQITYLEGETELSADVRLATSDVLPFIRKTIRSGLSAAGIRVVANKKQFVVSINVVDIRELNLQDVPPEGRDNYYEMSLIDNMIEVRAHSQMGAMWGAQTFAAIFRLFGHGGEIPNLRIRDWSEQEWRGFFIDTSWGMESMAPDQWSAMMERLLRNKMNMVGLNVCGMTTDPIDGRPVDMLLVPIPGEEGMQTEIKLQWYSAKDQQWHRKTTLPRFFTDDIFRHIAAHAREKGLRLIPGLDAVSFSRILTHARREKNLLSLSSDELRTALHAFCQTLKADYLGPEENPMMISFAPLEEEAARTVFYGETPYEMEDFLIWFMEQTCPDCFSAIMVRSELLVGKDARVSTKFFERLQELNLNDRLWLVWDSRNQMKTAMEDLSRSGGETVNHWLSPVLCRDNWRQYQPRFTAIRESFNSEQPADIRGILATGRFDAGYLDHIQFLAQLCWNPWDKSTVDSILNHGALIFGSKAEDYRTGARLLGEAAELTAVRDCFYLPSAETGTEPVYPQSALNRLQIRGVEESLSELNRGIELARASIAALRPIAEATKEELDDFLIKSAGSLLAEAARIEGLCLCCKTLLEAEENPATAIRQPLLEALKQIETYKPKPLVPAVMAGLSAWLKYIDINLKP